MNLRQGVFQCYCLLTNLVVLNQKGMTADKHTKNKVVQLASVPMMGLLEHGH